LLLGGMLVLRGGMPANAPQLPAGADFVLQSADGAVDSKSLRGKVVLIYFGYTHCPDVCPASMAAGAMALKTLSTEERRRVRLLMVSVDPERDTLKHLKEYTAFFHPELIGVTGSVEEIAALAKAFGAGYIRQPAAADGSYAVDHTTSTYVVDPEGRLAAVLELGASNDRIVSTIRKLL
ncbi:MAG: SCO family protein, partial [Dechloromonas sp.]